MSAVASPSRKRPTTTEEKLEQQLHTMHPTGREKISLPMIADWDGPNLGRTSGGFRIVRKEIPDEE